MSVLTDEELAYFSNALSFGNESSSNESSDKSLLGHSLSVETEIPQVLAHILAHSKLTLLAEISYYRLFFPLKLNSDELGGFSPTLGTPEVIDIRGVERSWRLDKTKGVKVVDKLTQKDIEVLSLSSSGMTIKVPQEFYLKEENQKQHQSQLILPNGIQLDMVYETVRTENGVMAVKINAEGLSREALREFLFNEHKAKYSHLYQNLDQE